MTYMYSMVVHTYMSCKLYYYITVQYDNGRLKQINFLKINITDYSIFIFIYYKKQTFFILYIFIFYDLFIYIICICAVKVPTTMVVPMVLPVVYHGMCASRLISC